MLHRKNTVNAALDRRWVRQNGHHVPPIHSAPECGEQRWYHFEQVADDHHHIDRVLMCEVAEHFDRADALVVMEQPVRLARAWAEMDVGGLQDP